MPTQALVSEEQANTALEQHLRYSGATHGSGALGCQHLSCVILLIVVGIQEGELTLFHVNINLRVLVLSDLQEI